MKTKIVIVITLVAGLFVYAQDAGYVSTGTVTPPSDTGGCSCPNSPTCPTGPGNGCTQLGTTMVLCNCMSGQQYMQVPNYVANS